MSTPDVLRLEEYRGRREQRLRQTLALHRGHPVRSRLLQHLETLADSLGADRFVVGWIEEYGEPRVHPFAALDLSTDAPRRSVDTALLLQSWKAGVPGIAFAPPSTEGSAVPGRWAVSLGSDGLRLWFLFVEAGAGTTPLDAARREVLMFLAGQCGAMVLHRDLDEPSVQPGRAVGASVRSDGLDDAESRALAGVIELARCILDEGLAPESGTLEYRLEVASQGLTALRDRAGPAAVVDAARRIEPGPLAVGLAGTAKSWEDRGAYETGARIWELAYEAACVAGDGPSGGRAARGRARALRRQARWDEAMVWYDVARGIARAWNDTGEEAVVLDGMASVHLGRGRVPAARTVLEEARALALLSGDPDARGAVRFSLMTLAHTEGRLDEAAAHGWEAFRSFRSRDARLRALTALGGVFLTSRRLQAAEDAFAVVERESREAYYRLYALAGLARVQAARGDRAAWEAALHRLDAAGLEGSAPELRAEALLERGDGYRELGAMEEARRWYDEAVRVAEAHHVHEYLIRAEQSRAELDRLGRQVGKPVTAGIPTEGSGAEASAELMGEVAAIRRDLDALRRGRVEVGGRP